MSTSFQMIMDAYVRGNQWAHENGLNADGLSKAAYDYADKTLSALETEAVEQHADDVAVDRFALAMKAKLAKKRAEGRGGWDRKDECTADFLSQLLREHVEKGDPVDVGNLAMMLQQRGERIAHPPHSSIPTVTGAMIDTAAHALETKLGLGQPWEEICEMADIALTAALSEESKP